jgi:hypothetical protein
MDRGFDETATLPVVRREHIGARGRAQSPLDMRTKSAHPAQASPPDDDQDQMTVALIAVGVEFFGVACGVALAKAAATEQQ